METALEIKKLGEEMDAKMKQVAEQVTLGATDRISSDLKTEVQNMAANFKALQEKQADELRTEFKKAGLYGAEKEETFGELLIKGIDANKDNVRSKRSFELQFEAKAAEDMGLGLSAGTNLAAGILRPDRRAGIQMRPDVFNHVRDFMTVRPTTSSVISYVQEGTMVGTPATVAEGELKPQIAFTLTEAQATITKIAAHLRLSEELIEDVPYITNYVTTRGTEELRLVEDQQLLYGSGTTTNIKGLNAWATAFARPAGIGTIANATYADIIRVAQAQLNVGRYRATAILLNPIDVALLELTKDAQGGYLYVPNNGGGAVATIWRLPIVESQLVTAGSFFIGDFRNGAEILDRRALSVRFYDQDRDNAIRNMVTIVIEERLGLVVNRPASFIKGTFAAAKTALQAA